MSSLWLIYLPLHSQWGSINWQVAALVPDIVCCVFIRKKTFSTSQNNLAFIWEKCCHLTTCLHLMEPHSSGQYSEGTHFSGHQQAVRNKGQTPICLACMLQQWRLAYTNFALVFSWLFQCQPWTCEAQFVSAWNSFGVWWNLRHLDSKLWRLAFAESHNYKIGSKRLFISASLEFRDQSRNLDGQRWRDLNLNQTIGTCVRDRE